MKEFHKIPDYNNYLIYIFSKLEATEQNAQIRVSAGLQLKNNILQYYEKFQPSVKRFIQMQVLDCLGDESSNVRITAGGIISAIVKKGKLKDWPNLIETLVNALSRSDTPPRFIDGILSSVSMICEDSACDMCNSTDPQSEPVANILIPLLLKYLSHELSQFRYQALRSLNQFINVMPQVFINHFTDFLNVCVFLFDFFF